MTAEGSEVCGLISPPSYMWCPLLGKRRPIGAKSGPSLARAMSLAAQLIAEPYADGDSHVFVNSDRAVSTDISRAAVSIAMFASASSSNLAHTVVLGISTRPLCGCKPKIQFRS